MTVAATVESPAFITLEAPRSWTTVDFISDLHLSDSMPRTFSRWRDYMLESTADAIFILGDLFEVWIGDDSRHDPFEARCGEVLTAAARQRTVAFMAGNRDFLVGSSFLDACGIRGLSDPTLLKVFGRRIALSHGDVLCTSDLSYQQFRRQVRSATWQAEFLSAPLSVRRERARQMRDASERVKSARTQWADADAALSRHWLETTGASALIHGHTHRPEDHALGSGLHRHVLGDWDFDARPGSRTASMLRLTTTGLQRVEWPDSSVPGPETTS